MAKQAELYNWTASEMRGEIVLSGTVVNHLTIPDYTDVSYTSPVVRVEFRLNRYIAHTKSGSSYKLGVPKDHATKDEFLSHFPTSTA